MSNTVSSGLDPVFMHIPKTGGASIKQICEKHDIKVIIHNTRDPNYVSLAAYRRKNPNISSFAVVRNPWDRLVSAYFFLRDGGIKSADKADADEFVHIYDDFSDFVRNVFNRPAVFGQIHFRPQYEWITYRDLLIVDHVGKYEQLDTDVSCWLSSVGIEDEQLVYINKGSHDYYKSYYTVNTMEIVARAYAKDIQLFNYEF